MPLSNPITEPQIPQPIARDSEITAALNAHVGAINPHTQTQTFKNPIKAVCQSTGLITAIGNFSGNAGLEIQADAPGSASFLYFSRPGIYGVHFGLDSTNQLGIGGGNMGNFFRLFHEGTSLHARVPLPSASVGVNSCGVGFNNGTGTVEFCDYAGAGTGDAFNFYRLPSNSASPALSNRIARIDTTGAYISTSDKRVKSHIRSAPGLETLMNLMPVQYNHWDCAGYDDKDKTLRLGKTSIKKVGFLAQDVREVLPQAVSSTSSEQELYGLDYNCILACTVRAVQQQQQEITELRAQLQAISTKA